MQFPKFYLSKNDLASVYPLVIIKRIRKKIVSLKRDKTWSYWISDVNGSSFSYSILVTKFLSQVKGKYQNMCF